MRRLMFVLLLVGGAGGLGAEQRSAPSTFALTVDNIMRGPELVGYPPSDLRWAGDSTELYFEWRMPKEDEAATWKVGRAGGPPARLSDADRRLAPLPSGSWDAERRRILGLERGIPGRGPWLRRGDELGGRVQADSQAV